MCSLHSLVLELAGVVGVLAPSPRAWFAAGACYFSVGGKVFVPSHRTTLLTRAAIDRLFRCSNTTRCSSAILKPSYYSV